MTPARPEDVETVHLVLTAGCNLRCSYCYQNAKQDRVIGWDSVQQGIRLLLGSRKPEVSLVFYGGEPLLQFDLIRRTIEEIQTRAPQRRVRYQTITNGTLLRDEIVDFLARHEVHTRISLDGVAAAQEHRGRGTHPILHEKLVRLRRRRPHFWREHVDINLTLWSATLAYLAESFDYLLALDAREIHVSPMDSHDPGWRTEMMDALHDQFARVHARSLAHYRETGFVPLSLFRKRGEPDVHAPVSGALCGVGRGTALTVDVDGEVYGCVTFARSYQRLSPFLEERLDPLRLGRAEDEAFPKRLALYPAAARGAEIFDGKALKHSSYGRCGDCRYLAQCTVCPVSIGHIPGNTDPHRIPDHLCAFNLVTGYWRDRFPAQAHPLEVLLGKAPLPEQMVRLRQAVGARQR